MSRFDHKNINSCPYQWRCYIQVLIYHNCTLQITSRGLWEWRYQVGERTNRVWRSCGDLLEWTMGHRLWWLLVIFWRPGGLQTAGIPHHRFDISMIGNAVYILHSPNFKEVTGVVCKDLWFMTPQLQGWSPRWLLCFHCIQSSLSFYNILWYIFETEYATSCQYMENNTYLLL